MARRRERWRRHQGRVDPARLVFVDETWAKTNMTRTHGRAPRGERLVAHVPHGRWTTMTFLAALRHDRIEAPCVIDGPINGVLFTAWPAWAAPCFLKATCTADRAFSRLHGGERSGWRWHAGRPSLSRLLQSLRAFILRMA